MTKVGIGVSQNNNLIKAAKKAAQKAKDQLEGRKPKLLLFFCTFTYPKDQYQKSQEEIYKVFEDKEIPLAGGTTFGFFANNKYFFDISLFGKAMGIVIKALGEVFKPLKFTGACVIALESESIKVGVGIGQNVFKDPRLAGENAVKEAVGKIGYNSKTINGFLITPGTGAKNKMYDAKIIDGIISSFDSSFKLHGGGLCGKMTEEFMFAGSTFYNGKVYNESVIMVILDTKLEITYGADTSIEIVDKIGLVTKMKDEWTLEEINGKPAAEEVFKVAKKHMKNLDKEYFFKIPATIGLRGGYSLVTSDLKEDFFWPNFPSVVKNGKYLQVMSPNIKKGALLTLAKGTKKACIEASANATKSMIKRAGSIEFDFIMFFSCAVRGVVMGKDYFNEIKQIKNILKDKNVPVFGICSAGEQTLNRIGVPTAGSFIITIMGISKKIKK